MRGASAGTDGAAGYVIKPTAGQQAYMLRGDGTWGAQPVAGLPSQTGNSGKWLTTDGTNSSWTATLGAIASITAPLLTDLTLTGGSTGASLVLGHTAGASMSSASKLNLSNTTSASSSTVGALTIGNGTAATNVAIGAGVIYAGSKISVNNSGLGGVRLGVTSTTGGEIGVYADSSATTGANIGVASAPYGVGATSNTGFWANPIGGTNNIAFLAGNIAPPAVTASFYGTNKIITTDATASTGSTSGALQVAGGIYAGAASVFGGQVSITKNDLILSLTSATGTSANYASFNNTGGSHYIGTDSSAGGSFFSGLSTAYSMNISAQSGRDLFIGSGGKFIKLAHTSGDLTFPNGAATFAGVVIKKNYTVATLPAAASYTYGEAYVSDATQAAGTSLGSAPTGGGSVKRGVYSDGSSWLLR